VSGKARASTKVKPAKQRQTLMRDIVGYSFLSLMKLIEPKKLNATWGKDPKL
jgi:hypothetical protein